MTESTDAERLDWLERERQSSAPYKTYIILAVSKTGSSVYPIGGRGVRASTIRAAIDKAMEAEKAQACLDELPLPTGDNWR